MTLESIVTLIGIAEVAIEKIAQFREIAKQNQELTPEQWRDVDARWERLLNSREWATDDEL